MTTTEHGYNPYTRGCRCPICRRAKADYMRDRRAAAVATARFLNKDKPLHDFGKGSVAQYQEHGCRCHECVTANSIKRANEVDRQKRRQLQRAAEQTRARQAA